MLLLTVYSLEIKDNWLDILNALREEVTYRQVKMKIDFSKTIMEVRGSALSGLFQIVDENILKPIGFILLDVGTDKSFIFETYHYPTKKHKRAVLKFENSVLSKLKSGQEFLIPFSDMNKTRSHMKIKYRSINVKPLFLTKKMDDVFEVVDLLDSMLNREFEREIETKTSVKKRGNNETLKTVHSFSPVGILTEDNGETVNYAIVDTVSIEKNKMNIAIINTKISKKEKLISTLFKGKRRFRKPAAAILTTYFLNTQTFFGEEVTKALAKDSSELISETLNLMERNLLSNKFTQQIPLPGKTNLKNLEEMDKALI